MTRVSNMRKQDRYEIRHRVQLSDGRNIEVLYAPLPAAATAAGAARQSADSHSTPHKPGQTQESPALHVCLDCGGEHVHPLDWTEHSPERWAIVLRCPDCGHMRDGVFGRDMVERLDDELDRASAALLSDYRRLVHANMSEEIERLARALELDLIGPEDFTRARR